jgi:hypothetical protein
MSNLARLYKNQLARRSRRPVTIKESEMELKSLILAACLASASTCVAAKLPPPPPVDPAAAAAKAEKDKATAEKAKADLARYEDKSVANFQKNMKQAGKPVPKPTPIVVAAAPTPAAPAAAAAKAAPAAPPKK